MRIATYTFLLNILFFACNPPQNDNAQKPLVEEETDFQWRTERFADLQIVRYQIPGWEKLTSQQRIYTYYLTQAGYEGRDIMWAMNYRHNLTIRKAIENIVKNYSGDKSNPEWSQFMTYVKRVWFSNGIHHHYSMNKIMPGFSREYLELLLDETDTPLSGDVIDILFDQETDAKKVNLSANDDLLLTSAVNFYDPMIAQHEVETFYEKIVDPNDDTPVSYGLNSKIVRQSDGAIAEEVYKIGGLYGPAIEKIVGWLQKAVGVAENKEQADALRLLIDYYRTGDLETWDEYNIAWTQATEGDIDYISGFVEVYNDPLGYRGSFETIVEIKDFEASERMKVMMDNAQWFENNSPIMDAHKKENVVGVTYKVVNVAGKSGDASPSAPVGVNLPNANWIRSTYGSKSVSLGNIIDAYDNGSSGGFTDEFLYGDDIKARWREHGALADKLETALHEVIGHASGKLEAGIGTPKQTLKNYRSALEEGRADLVALYYMTDPKMVELGLISSVEVGYALYDFYVVNGLLYQLRRLQPGEEIEEAHMRNRQMIAAWAFDKGSSENVIEKIIENDKTYFRVNDYDRLRDLFGQLLRETQRIKSQGDFEAVRKLFETYGVKVDPELHNEVIERFKQLNSSPYSGLINPLLIPIMEGEEIVDVRVEYPDDFTEQMLYYSDQYGNL